MKTFTRITAVFRKNEIYIGAAFAGFSFFWMKSKSKASSEKTSSAACACQLARMSGSYEHRFQAPTLSSAVNKSLDLLLRLKVNILNIVIQNKTISQ